MVDAQFAVSREMDGWAIKHNGGVLGYARTRSEAVATAQDLRDWVRSQGGRAEFRIEETPSFAPGRAETIAPENRTWAASKGGRPSQVGPGPKLC